MSKKATQSILKISLLSVVLCISFNLLTPLVYTFLNGETVQFILFFIILSSGVDTKSKTHGQKKKKRRRTNGDDNETLCNVSEAIRNKFMASLVLSPYLSVIITLNN